MKRVRPTVASAIWMGHLLLATTMMLPRPSHAEIECRESWRGDSCTARHSDRSAGRYALDGRVPVLQKFDIQFTESARPIRSLEIGAIDDRTFRFELRDRNGGEWVNAEARFIDASTRRSVWREHCGLPGGTPIVTLRTASARDCRGTCVLSEEVNPHTGTCRWIRVLTGFSFRFTEPRARQLREVALRRRDGRLEATFKNDGNRRPFDVDVGYTFIPVWDSIYSNTYAMSDMPRGEDDLRYPGGGQLPLQPLRYADGSPGWNATWWQDRYLHEFSAKRVHDDGKLKHFSVDVQDDPVTVRFADDDGREDVTFEVLFSEIVYRIE